MVVVVVTGVLDSVAEAEAETEVETEAENEADTDADPGAELLDSDADVVAVDSDADVVADAKLDSVLVPTSEVSCRFTGPARTKGATARAASVVSLTMSGVGVFECTVVVSGVS